MKPGRVVAKVACCLLGAVWLLGEAAASDVAVQLNCWRFIKVIFVPPCLFF